MALTAAGCGGGSSEEKKRGYKDHSQPGQEPGQRGEGAAYSLVAIRKRILMISQQLLSRESIKEMMEEDPTLDIQLDYAENEAYKTKIQGSHGSQ